MDRNKVNEDAIEALDLHVGDQVGDRTRHIWADVFSSFDGIAISVKGEELEIYIAESFMKQIQ